MKASALWQISVSIQSEAEEAVVELVQRVFGLPASVYRKEGSEQSVVTTYPRQNARPDRSIFDALDAGLKRIEACGLCTRPGIIKVGKIKQWDWADAWKHHFKPIEIGRALLIKPSWSKRRAHAGQTVVVLDPGLSFGTGHHPTTEFCLKQLLIARRPDHDQALLDIGTGSGILAIAAAKLGYQPVDAFDSDPQAVCIARRNAKTNGVLDRISICQADLTRLPRLSAFKYQVVCANLTFDLLISGRNRIWNRLLPDSSLVLAGVLRSEFNQVSKHYRQAGLRLLSTEASQEWRSGLFVFDQG